MEDITRLYSFEPVINSSSELLILGTLPGPESLRMKQYYANPNNQFWWILYYVFDVTEIDTSYSGKLSFLLERGIALWDIFHSAERVGALDSDIKNGVPNDIPGLLNSFPRINQILLNGRKAEKSFYRYFPDIDVSTVYVPSTSSANAKKPLYDKADVWKVAIMPNR